MMIRFRIRGNERELWNATRQLLPSAQFVGGSVSTLTSNGLKRIGIDGYAYIEHADTVILAELVLKFGIHVEPVITKNIII